MDLTPELVDLDYRNESEVHKLIREMTSIKDLNESLFNLVCCYVGNAFHIENDPERRFNMFETISAKFRTLLNGLQLKENLSLELFRYLPNNTWPPSFLIHVESIQACQPPDNFFPRKEKSTRILAKFGEKIWTTFIDVKAVITGKYHPHWDEIELNRSGNSMSAFLTSIREKIWFSALESRSTKKIKNQLNYQNTPKGMKS